MKLYFSSLLLTSFIAFMIIYIFGMLVEGEEIIFGGIILLLAVSCLNFGLKLLIDYIKNGG